MQNTLDPCFWGHNTHLSDPLKFAETDPNLRRLVNCKHSYTASMMNELPKDVPGIYTITGGRQIGKTTLLKQWMNQLLKSNVAPQNIVFFTGEMIDDHHSLTRMVQNAIASAANGMKFIIVDEVTYIKDWDKAIKFLADLGIFEDVVVMLTGSDLLMLQEARMRFPGRRGTSDKVDFHLYPLSFREVVNLKYPNKVWDSVEKDLLLKIFEEYLIHGGYMTAINDYAESGVISTATKRTYSDWVRGDMLKKGKNEHYLRDVMTSILRSYGSQVTWNSLVHHASINHPQTIQDYVNLLEMMDVVFIQHALIEDKLTYAPKKAKKILFNDPFIYHCMMDWLGLEIQNIDSLLAETAAISNIKRFYPTYYIKAEGEVDIAYIKDNKFWPIEVKWTNQMRSKDLKQIQKYSNGIILCKNKVTDLENSHFLPWFLYHFP